MWLSLLAVRGRAADRPSGVYAVGAVDYLGDTLAYRELFVARPVRARLVPGVRITDIWVDSEASLEGGRALWAIPKQLARLDLTQQSTGLLLRVRAQATVDEGSVATATFTTSRLSGPRMPIRFTVHQQRGQGTTSARLIGSARWTPATGRWSLPSDGPLGWLSQHRPLVSMCLTDFRLRVGG